MNRIKQISLFLLLGFSVLLGHSLVPHHHHTEVLPGTLHKDCPVEHKDHHDSDDNPLHCHAFNNVDFFKVSPVTSGHQPKILVTLMIPVTQLSIETPPETSSYRYAGMKLPVQSVRYSGAISPRAPPELL